MEWWLQLSPGQGSFLSGVFTALGAVLGIVIAGKFFSGKVKTLKEALDEAQRHLEAHSQTVKSKLSEIEFKLIAVDEQAGSLSLVASRIEANVGDIADEVEKTESNTPAADNWAKLREIWFSIRDELVRRASDDSIDGRTRAAYGRVDKRMIYELIEKMKDRGDLSGPDARAFDEALQIWNRYKNRRRIIEATDLARATSLRDRLAVLPPQTSALAG